jgi:hypothetical protein
MQKMKTYLLHFHQTGSDIPLYWRCEAEDYEHAVEQLKDEVEHAQGEKLIFVEKIK